jgi:hypothetical protein
MPYGNTVYRGKTLHKGMIPCPLGSSSGRVVDDGRCAFHLLLLMVDGSLQCQVLCFLIIYDQYRLCLTLYCTSVSLGLRKVCLARAARMQSLLLSFVLQLHLGGEWRITNRALARRTHHLLEWQWHSLRGGEWQWHSLKCCNRLYPSHHQQRHHHHHQQQAQQKHQPQHRQQQVASGRLQQRRIRCST